MEATITALLKALSAFQSAAKDRDPLKAKYSKRFVLGMRQTHNAIKAGSARLVLLPPDIEASECLDGVVESLLAEAEARGVPLCYCLSRRRLGKALGSGMRQSAVAVYSAGEWVGVLCAV